VKSVDLIEHLENAHHRRSREARSSLPPELREEWFAVQDYARELFGALSYVRNRGAHPEPNAMRERLESLRRAPMALLESERRIPDLASAFLTDLLVLDSALIHGGLCGSWFGTLPTTSTKS